MRIISLPSFVRRGLRGGRSFLKLLASANLYPLLISPLQRGRNQILIYV